jgi:hypothetical protein
MRQCLAAGDRVRQMLAASKQCTPQKETSMSSIAISASPTAALPTPNIHPHGHGHHKKGSDVDPLTDDSTSGTAGGTAAQPATGSTQNIFGSLLTTLEQVIGIQQKPQAQAAQPVQAAQAQQLSVGSRVNLTA